MNSVEGVLSSSFYDKKRPSTKVSDKDLKDNSYRWDPNVRQFIRVWRQVFMSHLFINIWVYLYATNRISYKD